MNRPARLALLALSLAALACSTLFPPRPEIAWDPSPQAVVLRAANCCGMVPYEVALNYIPDATLWGDGRIVWVELGAGGERRVREGRLTPDEQRAFLDRIAAAGFFGWQSNYGDYSVTDLASQCLGVTLTSTSHQVCEYYRGAPAAFDDLYAAAAEGAGAAGADFIPERGYLIAQEQGGFISGSAPVSHWPAVAAGFSLAEASAGRWVEGEALQAAWAAVNVSLWGQAVEDDGRYYRLVVQVPGLSQSEPPTP
ncbi:MAG: hypothetical protein JNK29_14725 [Anaerolineales bacterium]|nr:hypothetical protein [Anaerolineales bacterium]